jgi:hypothetical protein
MRFLNFLVWGVWIADANCPFKLMRRHALKNVLMRVPPDSSALRLVLLRASRHSKRRRSD